MLKVQYQVFIALNCAFVHSYESYKSDYQFRESNEIINDHINNYLSLNWMFSVRKYTLDQSNLRYWTMLLYFPYYVVIHFCDCVWSFWVESNLCIICLFVYICNPATFLWLSQAMTCNFIGICRWPFFLW